MNKPSWPAPAVAMSQAPSLFLVCARLWLALACSATLAAHAAFSMNIATAIGLLGCCVFSGLHLRYFLSHRAALLNPTPPLRSGKPWAEHTVLPTLLGAMAIAIVAWQHKTILGKEAGLACLTVLAAFKLWECRQARDVQVLVGLLFFLQLGVFLREESLISLCAVLVAAVLTLSAWVFFSAQPLAAPKHAVQHPIKLLSAPLKETLRLAALGIPLAAVLFFVFPRIAGPLWGLPQDATSSRIGLSNSLESGRFAQLAASDELALRAKFEGTPPPAQALYWRGPVLSQFDGLVWRPIESTQRMQASQNLLNLQQNYRYTLVAEPHKLNLRVLLDLPLAASGGVELSMQASPTGAVMLERETVQAISSAQLRWGIPRYQSTAQQRMALQSELDLPAGANPKTLAYASELRRNLGVNEADPTPFVQAILNHYRSAFVYTLSPPTPPGRKLDAIDGFLFDTKAGYCEHFAASFVLVMRALDFPARIVTGYQGGELNPQDGWITVRQSDAHAWAEVLHPTQGWLRVDPTAAVAPWRVEAGGAALQSTAGQAPAGLGVLAKATRDALLPLRQWAEASARIWQDYGLNYGKDRQKELFKRFGFPDVDAASIAAVFGGGFAVWLVFAAWAHRNRRTALSAHARMLAAFDAKCRPVRFTFNFASKATKHSAQNAQPRLPGQTPRMWLSANAGCFNSDRYAELHAAVIDYESASFAPVK